MLETKAFTGGITATNGYWVSAPNGGILVDAPEGVADWLDSEGLKVSTLLLTHGHFDHVLDAAAVQTRFGCGILAYEKVTPELTLESLLRDRGMEFSVDSFDLKRELKGESSLSVDGLDFDLLHVPGHSLDSLCFFHRSSETLFAGDTLMAGGLGRTDFPGGSEEQLLEGIRTKLFPLGDEVRVLSGHGPVTTIGREKSSPFF